MHSPHQLKSRTGDVNININGHSHSRDPRSSYDRKFARASHITSIPGHPRIRDGSEISSFLVEDLCTPELDEISPWLWLISTPSYTNITALHRQKLRGREIVVMEDPGLHLVWHRGAIYIKPIPRYLLGKDFRKRLLGWEAPSSGKSMKVAAAVRGYLRTYAFLIRHESDFCLAQSEHLRLVPKDIDWDTFSEFISEFEGTDLETVSPRFQTSGELRFSRLTILVKSLLRRWHYRYTHGTYKDYLETFYAPMLFVFATVSVVLNAMQVRLAVDQLDTGQNWQSFWSAARGFALFTMIVTVILAATLIMLLCRGVVNEVIYALTAQVEKRLMRRKEATGQPV